MTNIAFIKSFLIDCDEDTVDELCETIIDDFNEMFPEADISILKTINNWYDGTVFCIDGRYGRFDKEDPLSVSHWMEVDKIELSTTECKRFGPNTFLIEILRGSKDNIKYELYPFEQGSEFSIASIGFELTQENSEEFKATTGGDNRTVFELGDICIKIGCDDGIRYTLIKDGEVISGFIDPSYSFQEGDTGSHCYLHDGKIILENYGDVSSVVIIHGVFE